jgi:hypothetical protein
MRIERDSLKKILLSVLWLMLMVVRSGLHFQTPPAILLETVKRFPEPVSFASSNILPIFVLHVLGIDSEFKWKVFSSVLTASVFLTILVSIQFRSGGLKDLYSAFAISTPIFTLLAGNVGLLDIFPFIFWLLFFFGPLKFRSTSILLLMLSSPEQGLVSLIAIWFLEKSHGKSFTNNQIKKLILQCMVILVLLNLWILFNRIPSRGWLLVKNFFGSAEVFILNFPHLFLSGYGPIWLIIFYYALRFNYKSKCLFFVSVVLVPTIFTIFTLDGSRVFILVSIPLVIIILREIAHDESSFQMLSKHRLMIILILLSYPTMIVYGGLVYQPLNYDFINTWMSNFGGQWSLLVESIQKSLGRL